MKIHTHTPRPKKVDATGHQRAQTNRVPNLGLTTKGGKKYVKKDKRATTIAPKVGAEK